MFLMDFNLSADIFLKVAPIMYNIINQITLKPFLTENGSSKYDATVPIQEKNNINKEEKTILSLTLIKRINLFIHGINTNNPA